jgi:crossover junction endodeoxyribonuclease RuvC
MTILGIDPGTATTGFGIIEKRVGENNFGVLDFGVITTAKTDSDARRLEIIAKDLKEIIRKFKPDRIGIEKLFFTNNQKTAMAVSQARGVALLVCQQAKLSIFEFTPLQVKNYLCGNGQADKRQVQFMVKQTFKLDRVPKPDDAADALAIALCAALALKIS